MQKHLGAGEARRAHNPEVRRSKLWGANLFIFQNDFRFSKLSCESAFLFILFCVLGENALDMRIPATQMERVDRFDHLLLFLWVAISIDY